MTYDFSSEPLKERWFLSLLILKRKVCLPQKDEKEKKKFWKFVGSYRELNPGYLGEMPDCQPLHYPDIGIRRRRVWESVFYDKNYNFTNPSLPQIEMIDIGHKSLPIIIGPYSMLYCILDVHKSWIVWGLFNIVKSKSVFIEQIHMFIVTELYWPE